MANDTRRFCSKKGIWNFTLTKAPWQGGFWERLAALSNKTVKKVIGKIKMTFDKIQIIIVEVKNILNDRPLCYEDDIEGIEIYRGEIIYWNEGRHNELINSRENTNIK